MQRAAYFKNTAIFLSTIFLVALFAFIPSASAQVEVECAGADIMLVLDESGSMSGDQIDDAKVAAKVFAKKTFEKILGHRIGVVWFDHNARLVQVLTDSLSDVEAAIDAGSAGGTTSIDEGIEKALEHLDADDAVSSVEVMIVLSDGDQPGYDAQWENAFKSRSGIIFTIGLGSDADEALLKDIASGMPPFYYASPDSDDLEGIFADLANKLPTVDGDEDGVITADCPGLCEAHGGCDADDTNPCVSSKAPEGACVAVTSECEIVWTPEQCEGAENNICNLYRDNNFGAFDTTCEVIESPVSSGNFYASCEDLGAGDSPIDNDQDGAANDVEITCPKEGGLVPCGRYSDDPTTPINEQESCSFCHFFYLIDNIITFLFTRFLPVLAMFFIVLAGMLILTSRGNSQQLSTGKQMLIWTLVGLFVLAVGWALFNSFFTYVGAKKWTGVTGEGGTILSVSGSTFTVTGAGPWETNEWVGLGFTITDSTIEENIGVSRMVTANESNRVTTAAWAVTPDADDTFQIGGWWQFACGVNFGVTPLVSACGEEGRECCAGGSCDGPLECDGSNICVPPAPIVCGGDGEDCCAGDICDIPGLACDTDTNMCEVCGGSSQICCTDPSIDPCGSGQVCDEGTCVPLPPSPCLTPNECVADETCGTTVTGDKCPLFRECCAPTTCLTPNECVADETCGTTVTGDKCLFKFDECCAPTTCLGSNECVADETCGTTVTDDKCLFIFDECCAPFPLPPTVTLTASPNRITEGDSTTLEWTVTDADTCTASSIPFHVDWGGGKDAADGTHTQSITPVGLVTHTYRITCTNTEGSDTASVDVMVNPAPPPPLTVDLRVSDTFILDGQSVTLDWTVTGADTCESSGAWGSKTKYAAGACDPVSCAEDAGPLVAPGPYIFIITCVNAPAIPVSDSVTVEIAGPVPTPFAHWPFTDLDISRRIQDWGSLGQHGWYMGQVWRDGRLGDGACTEGTGTCPAFVAGPAGYGRAFQFDNVDDYIEAPNTISAFNFTDGWTISAWAKPLSVGTDAVSDPIVWKVASDGGNDDTFFLGWGDPAGGNVFKAGFERDDGDIFEITSSPHALGNWYRVVATYGYDPGPDQTRIRLFVYDESGGGGLEKALVIPGRAVAFMGPAPLRIGSNLNGDHVDGGTFHGAIDEVRIYDKALTPGEVNEERASRYPVVAPVASWSFENIENGKTFDTHRLVQGKHGGAGHFDTRDDNGDATIDPFNPFDPADTTEFDFVIIANQNPVSAELTIKDMTMPTTDISIGFWMRTDDKTNRGTPFSYNAAPSPPFDNEFRIYKYDDFEVNVNANGTPITGVSATDGDWRHIVATWNAASGDVQIYKDGALAFPGALVSGSPIDTGGALVFGQDQDSLGGGFNETRSFKGQIDDMKIWDSVLTDAEVLAEFTAGP